MGIRQDERFLSSQSNGSEDPAWQRESEQYSLVLLVTRYSSSVNVHAVQKALKQHQHVLNACFPNGVQAAVAHSVQKDLFKRHYADHWVQRPVEEGG